MAKWLLVLLTLYYAAAWSQAVPPGSSTGNRVDTASETDKQILTLQDQVKKSPDDFSGYDGLGAAFLQKARETGDIDYYNLAEQTLKKALALVPQDFRAADPSIHMALVCMGEHRFADALAFAQKAIATGSGSLAAFAIEGDAYTDLGDYDEAGEAYDTVQTLGQLTTPPLMLAYMSDSRMAYLRHLHGESSEALRLMGESIAAALQAKYSPRESRLALFRIG
jgi:tetratricopeptide (TPR) repeat protein